MKKQKKKRNSRKLWNQNKGRKISSFEVLKKQQRTFQKRFAYLVFGLIAIFIGVIFITGKL